MEAPVEAFSAPANENVLERLALLRKTRLIVIDEYSNLKCSIVQALLGFLLAHQCRVRVLLVGDMNFQPDELGGGREPRRKRQNAWARLRKRWGLILHNPQMCDGEVETTLPRRQRIVKTRTGSTRHGPGQGCFGRL